MIQLQHDDSVIPKLKEEFNSILDTVRLTMEDIVGTHFDREALFEHYMDYKKQLKKMMINKNLENISNILLDRFGLKIKIVPTAAGISNIADIVMPVVNYKTLNQALMDIDELFPKKKEESILWGIMANKSEQIIYKTLNDIKEAVQVGNLNIDLKRARVNGLQESEFIIRMDFLACTIVDLSISEIVALLMHEIGHIFTYLEYVTMSAKNTITLVDTFIHERFNKGNDPIESLTIAIKKSEVDVDIKTSDPVAILESLDMYILKSYRLDPKLGSINIDFERAADRFATNFELGDDLASAMIKIATKGNIQIKKQDYKKESPFLKILRVILTIIQAVIGFLLFTILGPLFLIILFGYKALKLVISLIFKFLSVIFNVIFSKRVNTNIKYDDLHKRIKKIKLELIRELRRYDDEPNSVRIIMAEIENVKNGLKKLDDNLGILYSYGDNVFNTGKIDDYELLNDFVEELQENELHYYKHKFN